MIPEGRRRISENVYGKQAFEFRIFDLDLNYFAGKFRKESF